MKKLLMIMLVVVLCFGCQKKPVAESSVPVQEAPPAEETTVAEESFTGTNLSAQDSVVTTVPASRAHLDFSFLRDLKSTDNTSFHADAHKKYLDDKLDFSHYDQISSEITDDCYLVGSEFCKFYPRELLILKGNNTAVLNPDFKGEGIPIPLGTILKAAGTKEPIKNNDKIDSWCDAFEFEEIYNYFYEVEYKGQTGLVFGADLGISLDNYEHIFGGDKIKYYADMYIKDGKLDYFSPLEGIESIQEDTLNYLLQNRIVLKEIGPRYISVDDLIDEYNGINYFVPMFVTTDLASHSQHLIFDRLLQYTEETFFVPRLKILCSAFIDAIKERSDAPEDIRRKALSYFQVPELILSTAPVVKYVSDGWHDEKKYSTPDNIQDMLKAYPDDVQEDFKQIQDGSGEKSVVFGTREDFSQYKPRGHYTKNGVLEAYFRASMWFGRIHFAITDNDEAEKMTPIAMFIVDTVRRNPELYQKWSEVFEPITALIGESDDLGFPDILPLWNEQKVDDFNNWVSNKENFISFMKICKERLKSPAISSNTVLLGFDDSNEPMLLEKPPMGWRFLGQRYTLDADLFQQVCIPNIEGRTCVRGLDIMRIFGSPVAESFLAMEDYDKPTEGNIFAGGSALKNAHETLQSRVDKLNADYWNKTYYSNILGTIRAQATFGQGAGFYFTECPMWNMKSLISAHATWAELKHDTILYAKQSYAEKGGGDDWDVTYRTNPLPDPKNYIEPNLSFWELSMKGIEKLFTIYNSFRLMDSETERILESLLEMYSRIYNICNKEVADEAVSEDENRWIRTIPHLLADYVMIHQDKGDIKEQKDLQMACIADVFTNSDIEQCLEVGIGVPYKMYVPLNDCNGKRIAVGYIPSYYEFYHPASNRLNDDEWKTIVYNKYSDMSKYKPFWSKSCILPAIKF